MNAKFSHICLVMVFALTGLIACGGTSDGTNVARSGGIGGTGVSYGPMTKGSIIVNGVRFSTNGATIVRDDVGISEDELQNGMTVEVQGSIDSATSGVASTVFVKEAVRGPVESKTGTASAGTLVVLGQTVQVDDTTLIDNNVCDSGEACGTADERFAAIDAGDRLEVHGHRRANGTIAAAFTERKTELIVFAVRGTVTDHNTGGQTFKVGSLTVNYASATVDDMPAGNWDGLLVEVKGNDCAGSPVCGTLDATKVESEGLGLAAADRAEIEGFVTALTSPSNFTVNAQRVLTTAATVFSGGLQSEIVVGVKLEVEGSLAGGVLAAAKVQFKDSVKLESNASASGSAITLEGLPGITVTANAFTELDTTATATDLTPLDGKNVRIRGRVSGDSSVIATEIEDRGDADSQGDVILQGPVDNGGVSNPTFTILGVEVDTASLGENEFEDVNDNPIGRAAFFSALTANGGLVKAKGQLPLAGGSDNALAASTLQEVELED